MEKHLREQSEQASAGSADEHYRYSRVFCCVRAFTYAYLPATPLNYGILMRAIPCAGSDSLKKL